MKFKLQTIVLVIVISWINFMYFVSCEEKTFPGAIGLLPILIPAISAIGQAVLPGIIASIPKPPTNPHPVSISHTTSVGAHILDKPIAISHSGSLSTPGGHGLTSSSGQAHAGVGNGNGNANVWAGSVASGDKFRKSFENKISKRWRKFINGK